MSEQSTAQSSWVTVTTSGPNLNGHDYVDVIEKMGKAAGGLTVRDDWTTADEKPEGDLVRVIGIVEATQVIDGNLRLLIRWTGDAPRGYFVVPYGKAMQDQDNPGRINQTYELQGFNITDKPGFTGCTAVE